MNDPLEDLIDVLGAILSRPVKPDARDAAREVQARLDGRALPSVASSRRQLAPERFRLLRSQGWPNGSRAKSQRRMAKLVGISHRQLRRWLAES